MLLLVPTGNSWWLWGGDEEDTALPVEGAGESLGDDVEARGEGLGEDVEGDNHEDVDEAHGDTLVKDFEAVNTEDVNIKAEDFVISDTDHNVVVVTAEVNDAKEETHVDTTAAKDEASPKVDPGESHDLCRGWELVYSTKCERLPTVVKGKV